MLILEIIILLACIILAARLGGIGVGLAGGLGLGIVVFILGMKPGHIPVSVILIIMSVILALSTIEQAGGMAYMVKVSEKILRKNPKYINILAPLITFLLTILVGSGSSSMAVLNIIQEVAKGNGVRPSQPLTGAVLASQIAITASPISAATAAMYVAVESTGVSFGSAMLVLIPTAFVATVVAALVASRQGKDLKDDPIYQERLKQGLVRFMDKSKEAANISKEAKRSVVIFLLGVLFIVLVLMFKKQIGHHLGSKDVIVITMFIVSLAVSFFCKVPLASIKKASVFVVGAESLIIILGIVWLSSTIIGAYIPEIKLAAGDVLKAYPALLALVFFATSALLFSQGATSALLCPIAVSLGVDSATILACFVAASALFITNVYPSSAFAILIDDTGSYKGKWDGSMVINHPFILPGCLGVAVAVPFGFLMASLVI